MGQNHLQSFKDDLPSGVRPEQWKRSVLHFFVLKFSAFVFVFNSAAKSSAPFVLGMLFLWSAQETGAGIGHPGSGQG